MSDKTKPAAPAKTDDSGDIKFEFENLDGSKRVESLNLKDGWLIAGQTGGKSGGSGSGGNSGGGSDGGSSVSGGTGGGGSGKGGGRGGPGHN